MRAEKTTGRFYLLEPAVWDRGYKLDMPTIVREKTVNKFEMKGVRGLGMGTKRETSAKIIIPTRNGNSAFRRVAALAPLAPLPWDQLMIIHVHTCTVGMQHRTS